MNLSLSVASAFLLLSGCAPTIGARGAVEGWWSGPDGEISVHACRSSSNLCVTVVSGTDAAPEMAAIVGKVVVRDMVPVRQGVWSGRYVGEGKNLPATIKLRERDSAEFRVCLYSWLQFGLCEVQQYRRVGL